MSPHPRRLHARDSGLRRVRQITAWTAAGGVALTGGLAVLSERAFSGQRKATAVAPADTTPIGADPAATDAVVTDPVAVTAAPVPDAVTAPPVVTEAPIDLVNPPVLNEPLVTEAAAPVTTSAPRPTPTTTATTVKRKATPIVPPTTTPTTVVRRKRHVAPPVVSGGS